MDRNDASGHLYASHPYATPQSHLPGTSSTTRSQYPAPGHLPSTQVTPQYTHTPHVSHPQSSPSGGPYETPGSASRFRGFEQSPTGLGIAGRGGDASSYGFTSTSHYATTGYQLPAQALQYHQPDARRQDTPQYHQNTFTADGMYVGPPATTQAMSHPVAYEQVTQHGQRGHDTPGQFASASNYGLSSSSSNQFYMPGGSVPSNASPANLPSSNLQFGHAEFPVTNPQSHSAFVTQMIDPTPQTIGGAYGSISHQPTPHAPSTMQVDLDRQEYDTHLRTIFTCVQRGDLSNVDEHLLAASSYLLLNIEPLRLHLDPENPNDERNRQLREQRVHEWDLFNWAWLSTLQRQLDATRHAFHSGRDPHVDVMTTATLEHLGSELVRMCDSVEKYGLVDYQAGVAEDEIIDLILRCLTVLETDPIAAVVTASSAASAGSISAAIVEPRHRSH